MSEIKTTKDDLWWETSVTVRRALTHTCDPLMAGLATLHYFIHKSLDVADAIAGDFFDE